jgi:hypothetical protein
MAKLGVQVCVVLVFSSVKIVSFIKESKNTMLFDETQFFNICFLLTDDWVYPKNTSVKPLCLSVSDFLLTERHRGFTEGCYFLSRKMEALNNKPTKRPIATMILCRPMKSPNRV